MNVLICCEFSGTVRDAFAALGHNAWSCDLLPSERPGNHLQCDLREALKFRSWDFVGFHTSCQFMANSGAKHLYTGGKANDKKNNLCRSRWAGLRDACSLFNLCLQYDAPGYLENPIPHCFAQAMIQRDYDQCLQPWHYGEPFFKGTCLWLKGVPPLQRTKILLPPKKGTAEHAEWSAVHRASPGPLRWKERSVTFKGIAAAMAAQWGGAQ